MGTMSFDDASQPMIWRDRKACEGMSHPEIVAALEAEAKEQGYEPMDRNWAETPNVYLRGRYGYPEGKLDQEEPVWIEDGFVMFVRKIGSED